MAAGGVDTASAAPPDALVAAAKQEGQLTVIALPHDWCGYGALIAGFQKKYGINDQRAESGCGFGRRSRSDQGEQGQQGAAGAGRDRRGSVVRPDRKGRRPAAAVQGGDVERDSRLSPRMRTATGTAITTACCAFEVNADMIDKVPADWGDLLKSGLQERRVARGRSALGQPGDPGRLRGGPVAKQGRCEQGRSGAASSSSPT